MNRTTIEWTDYTWNPVTGCHKVSPGCKHCYAETLTNRFAKTWGVKDFREIVLHNERLDEPQKNKKKWAGKKVFVCSMSDLFQDDVPFDFIAMVYARMARVQTTTFQILTKRPQRALEFYKWIQAKFDELHADPVYTLFKVFGIPFEDYTGTWPLPNVWIGTSCENQETANERIPQLLQIPAAVRFVSCEPLLGPIDLLHINTGQVSWVDSLRGMGYGNDPNDNRNYIHWVIAGGESGHGARPMHPDWVRSLRDQCARALVPFFFKQWGEYMTIDSFNERILSETDRTKTYTGFRTHDGIELIKVGKSKSGNLLDGKQLLQFPLSEITIHIERGFTPDQPPIELDI